MQLDIIYCLSVMHEICILYEFSANMYGGNGMMVDLSAHPLHMNILKHLLYVWSRCENHSMWVWNLNQCTLR